MSKPANEPYEDSAAFRAEVTAVADALRDGRGSTRFDPRAIREAVRKCAVHARLSKCPPEKLVRALKALVREIALEDDTDAYRVLYTDRVIAWAIESYYELSDR
jgi:phage-related protein